VSGYFQDVHDSIKWHAVSICYYLLAMSR